MKSREQAGFVVLIALAAVSVVSIFAFVAVGNIASMHARLQHSANWQRAMTIAGSGVESAIASLSKDPGFGGEKEVSFDGGTFTTEITKPEPADDVRIIRSRSLFRSGRQRTYRKELLVAVRLLESGVETLWRRERTPIE
jgi:hypothetical protein